VAREELSAQELYKRSLRVRLTRAGLVKIMRENEAREKEKEENGESGTD
jgi:hypothetical protein